MVYGVVVVGLGNISLGYDQHDDSKIWTHCKAIQTHPNYKLVAGIDPSFDARSRFEGLTAAPSYGSLDDFHTENKLTTIDVVVIATPTEFHMDTLRKAKDLKPSLVILEKPVSNILTNDDLMFLQNHRKKLVVNLFRLYQPTINQYLSEISQAQCKIRGFYSKSALHNGIHFLTLIEKHYGKVVSVNEEIEENGTHYEFMFENAEFKLEPCFAGLDNNSLEIHCDKGSLYYLSGGRHSFFIDRDLNRHEFPETDLAHYQYLVYEHCLSVMQGIEDTSLELALSAHTHLSESNYAIV